MGMFVAFELDVCLRAVVFASELGIYGVPIPFKKKKWFEYTKFFFSLLKWDQDSCNFKEIYAPFVSG